LKSSVEELFNKLSVYLDLFAKGICILTTGLIVIVILSQIVFRLMGYPLEWYLEVVQISFVWDVFMGIAIVYKSGRHIRFSFIYERWSTKMQRILSCIITLFEIGFFVFIVQYGIKLFTFSKPYLLPTLEISKQWTILCIPISGLILLIHALNRLPKYFRALYY